MGSGPNISSKGWLKKFGDDRGYGSDESKTVDNKGTYDPSSKLSGFMGGKGKGGKSDLSKTKPGGKPNPSKPVAPSRPVRPPAPGPTAPVKKKK